MAKRPSNLSLLFGVGVSIIVHLTVLVPLLMMAMAATKQPRDLHTELPAEELAPPEKQPEPDEPKLGIDRGTPSSISWIGHEEYEEHLARLAQLEQAAFTREPSGAMGTDVDPVPVPMEEIFDAAEQQQEAVAEVVRADEDPVVDEGEDASEEKESAEAQDVVDGEPDEAIVKALEDAVEVENAADDAQQRDTASERAEVVAQQESESEPESESESETETESEPEAQSEGQTESDRDAEEVDQAQRDVPPGEVRDGDEADKDADATSVIDVPRESWRLGRPLAARGVEIKPERPHFTLLQLMTGLPRNPIVGIRFNNRGVPHEAVILRSSGDRSIDAAILASLYRWRAEGEAIDALEDAQTFDIDIRIVLVQRRDED